MKTISINYLLIFFLIVILNLCSSCSIKKEENTTVIKSFPEEKLVDAKSANWISPYKPIGLLQIDSFLVIINVEGKYAFQIYNTNTKTLVKECGKFGRGPNEFLMPRCTGQYTRNEKGIFFYIYSGTRKAIYTINFDKLLTGKDYITEKNDLSKELYIQTHLIKVDSLVIGISDGTKGKIFAYNLYNNNINLWDYYPEISNIKSFNDPELYVLYARLWVYNQKRNLLAGTYNTFFNQLVFYTPQGKLIKKIKLPTTEYKLRAKNFTEQAPTYATGITCAKDLIYISSKSEAYQNISESKFCSVINVFDWDGTPKKQYRIKNALIWMPVVDEINQKIYAYAPENQESLIVEIDL